jgi:2,3,4,5-tetrahydropyridine-2-carboxylate N-succinyltransferase
MSILSTCSAATIRYFKLVRTELDRKLLLKWFMTLQQVIEDVWVRRELLGESEYENAIHDVIDKLDNGVLRVATSNAGGWDFHVWIRKALVLYLATRKMETVVVGPFEFNDKMALKSNYKKFGARVVPHAVAHYGAFVNRGAVLMPSHVGIGAYIDQGTTVDTWATVGVCAQIGKNVHLSGGVAIGGILDPIEIPPAIIEDNAFIGSRCIIGEGVRIGREAVLGASVVLTKNSKIIDVTREEAVEHEGYVPERSVVIPGSFNKIIRGLEFGVPCNLIIGKRKESTDKKTSLNDALHANEVPI